jgi:hypothetical protein
MIKGNIRRLRTKGGPCGVKGLPVVVHRVCFAGPFYNPNGDDKLPTTWNPCYLFVLPGKEQQQLLKAATWCGRFEGAEPMIEHVSDFSLCGSARYCPIRHQSTISRAYSRHQQCIWQTRRVPDVNICLCIRGSPIDKGRKVPTKKPPSILHHGSLSALPLWLPVFQGIIKRTCPAFSCVLLSFRPQRPPSQTVG